MLYNDERSSKLKNFRVLEIMYNGRILRSEEERKFEEMLTDSQNVVVEGGLTVLQRAVYEHNMLAVSSIYKNISLDELGCLLGISPARVIVCHLLIGLTVELN
jgi:COP9 signalosome complex subunit 4